MYKFIKEINNNNDMIWKVEDMLPAISDKDTWLSGGMVITKEDVVGFCNERIIAMVKILPGSIRMELDYLQTMIRYFKSLRETFRQGVFVIESVFDVPNHTKTV